MSSEQESPTSATSQDESAADNADVVITPAEDHEEFSTLDEPVLHTVMRDGKAVGMKFVHVVFPKKSQNLLREWDLWGPLILCTFLALMLHSAGSSGGNDGGPDFAKVFIIYWVGAGVVTLNSKLLGGSISFFQSVCVLGYCAFPLTVALIVCRLILFLHQNNITLIIRSAVVLCSFLWSTFASTAFFSGVHLPNRKALAIYPIGLFYFIIGWMVLSHKP